MKIEIEAHEIVDAQISKISLVKHGAIRAPFKIMKSEAPDSGGNPTVILRPQPDNGEAALGYRVDDRYPLGRPDDVMRVRKNHSLDGMITDARRRKLAGW